MALLVAILAGIVWKLLAAVCSCCRDCMEIAGATMDVGGFFTATLIGAAVCRGETTRAVLLLSVDGPCCAKKINKNNFSSH